MIATPRAYVRPPWSASLLPHSLSEAGTSRNYRNRNIDCSARFRRGGIDETIGRAREYNRLRSGNYCGANIFREIRHASRRDERKFIIFDAPWSLKKNVSSAALLETFWNLSREKIFRLYSRKNSQRIIEIYFGERLPEFECRS